MSEDTRTPSKIPNFKNDVRLARLAKEKPCELSEHHDEETSAPGKEAGYEASRHTA